ncbi:MAG TPA: hypothetical protein VFZ59_00305 [Verrucomicrobiae bacterium]|nr:hypothetical protein [Verrucomicrobiae bacterium]
MRLFSSSFKFAAGFALLLAASTGCETTDGGGSASVGMYYGVGFYDPWYYGGYDDDPDIIVTPPDRPDRPSDRPRPSHPIANAPSASTRPARSMPSIPSTPRVSARGGGGGRR